MTTAKLIQEIEEALVANDMYYGVSEANKETIAIEVSWGDWKHDHFALECFMEESFPHLVYGGKDITEEDGSDCYSAVHYFIFRR